MQKGRKDRVGIAKRENAMWVNRRCLVDLDNQFERLIFHYGGAAERTEWNSHRNLPSLHSSSPSPSPSLYSLGRAHRA